MHSSLLAVDIETVPDRDIIPVDAEPGAFPKPIQHRVVAISFVAATLVRDSRGLETYRVEECRSGGTEDSSEADLLRGFWGRIAREKPRVVTWNGRGFDMPVLFQRAMLHGVPARTWFQLGDRWNGYRQRYSVESHCDLMDAIADHGASTKLRLEEAAIALGLPGKLGVHGADVASMMADGRIADVRAYCETDVLNLFGVYVRWAFVTGRISANGHNEAMDNLVQLLEAERESRPHFAMFLDQWRASSRPAHVAVQVSALEPATERLEDGPPPHLSDEDVLT